MFGAARISLYMYPTDMESLELIAHESVEMAVFCDRMEELRDLISHREIRIEIALAVELRFLVHRHT